MPPERCGFKQRLLRVITAAETREIAELLDELWASGRFATLRAPKSGLIMFSVKDPFDTPFHLGEVLVSEAEAVCDGQRGCGLICGDEPERALLLAAVEAAELSGHPDLLDRISAAVGCLEKKHGRQTVRMAKLAAATEVRFESMKKESVDFGSLGD